MLELSRLLHQLYRNDSNYLKDIGRLRMGQLAISVNILCSKATETILQECKKLIQSKKIIFFIILCTKLIKCMTIHVHVYVQ